MQTNVVYVPVSGKPAAAGSKNDVDWVPTLFLGRSTPCLSCHMKVCSLFFSCRLVCKCNPYCGLDMWWPVVVLIVIATLAVEK